jgi:Tfp pilus assembly protein PilF
VQAKVFLERAVELDPSLAAARRSLGDLAFREGDLAGAEGHFRDALAADPCDVAAHVGLGTALCKAGLPNAADGHFALAARLAPACAAAFNNLGSVRFHQERFEEACRLFLRARQLDPHNPTVYRNLGAVQSKLGHGDDSVGSYTTCLRLAPDRSEVLLDLAEVHYARQEYGQALEMSEEFVRRAPGSGRGFAEMARCFEAMNQPRAALASYACAARIDPAFEWAAEKAEQLRRKLHAARSCRANG